MNEAFANEPDLSRGRTHVTSTAPAAQSAYLKHRWQRVLVVLAGLCAFQALLFGPSLVGRKILLPLELLAEKGVYLPEDTPAAANGAHDTSRFDLVLQFEPERSFAAHELAAGRWPRWLPYEYGGVPMRFSVLSPLFLLKASTVSPAIVAWAQLLVAIVAGLGMYRFCRRVLALGFWPATVAAWCYPLTGAFVFWQGFPVAETFCWFPWLLTAVWKTRRQASVAAIAELAVLTAFLLLSGQLDVAVLGLIAAAGALLLVTLRDIAKARGFRPAWRASCVPVGVCLGGLLAAPYVLPFLEYSRTGERIEQRAEGHREERPPVGVAAVPLVLWPDMDGRIGTGTLFFRSGNQMESASVGYAGIAATLLLVPLAWWSRRHRFANVLCAIAIVLGVGWCANLPGWVTLLRLPGLNLLSFNRFVFITGFALVAQAAIGLEVLGRQSIRRGPGLVVMTVLCLVAIAGVARRGVQLPEPLATQAGAAIAAGKQIAWIRTAADLQNVTAWYRENAAITAGFGAVALCLWLVVWIKGDKGRLVALLASIAAVAELGQFAWGRASQAEPSLYFPENPTLAAACRPGSGRVVGFFCFPANVAAMQGMTDARGYDPVEPARMTQLLRLGAHRESPVSTYTSTQWLAPAVIVVPPRNSRLAPALDLLGVRYVVSRGKPPPGLPVDFAGNDYWGIVNRYALPRVFVPARVECEPSAAARLRRMGTGMFNPREVAFVEAPLNLRSPASGSARIVAETPTQVRVAAQMETPGLLILADRWDVGWRASINGAPASIVRADHALRGVVLPAGASSVEFEYAPASFRVGCLLAGLAGAGLLIAGLLARARPARA